MSKKHKNNRDFHLGYDYGFRYKCKKINKCAEIKENPEGENRNESIRNIK